MKIQFIRDRLMRDGLQYTPQETRYRDGQILECSYDVGVYFIGCGDAVEMSEPPEPEPAPSDTETAVTPLFAETETTGEASEEDRPRATRRRG